MFGGGISSSSSPFGAAVINYRRGGEGANTDGYVIIFFECNAMSDFEVVYLFEEI